MSRAHALRELVERRLSAALRDVLDVFEKTVAKYEEEAALSRDVISRQRALLCALQGPRAAGGVSQLPLSKEDSGLEEAEPPRIKEEQGEIWTNQEAEQPGRDEQWAAPNLQGAPSVPGPPAEAGGQEAAAAGRLPSSEPDTEDSDDYGSAPPPPAATAATRQGSREEGGQSLTCRVCGRSFRATHLLMSHVSVHLDEPESVCGLCGKRLAAAAALRLHLQTHSRSRRRCDVCGRDFSSRQGLRDHMRTHTGERPFSCHVCCKRFNQRAHLRTHVKLHTGEKPYRCGACGKAFIQLSNQRRHKCCA
ncbi:endothelial zinc finger protein induced by tumor necrosis factor alpha-like [Myripristis murdjan]|uniref:endothelial zinc finger protein induced by tumor necrosis factor alpha-like n=1 Tax=Myripristis murdjan TaxID=586833 RepID=UPI001176289C|nr:endothelial zinc finger protein induced by tumor necrosis factor alpha-like [Myripristis murdjan]